MRRREFIVGLGSATAGTVYSITTRAQQPTARVRRLGILLYNSPQIDPIGPLLKGLNDLGYADGKTVTIDYRSAEGRAERLADLAVELVQLKPDVIFAYGGDVAPLAKRATATIPIIVMVSNDPVQSGLVASIAHPGGNVTGITLIYDDLAGKMLEFLKTAVPAVARVGVLWNPNHADPEFRETQRVAEKLGIALQPLPVRVQDDFDGAFQSAIDARAEGLIVVSTRLLLTQRKKILEFTEKNRVPAVGSWGDWAKDGLLLTYGPNVDQAMARVALYIDKILKGLPPSELPIERPSKFELVVNVKTAKSLGITIPERLLSSADEVIE